MNSPSYAYSSSLRICATYLGTFYACLSFLAFRWTIIFFSYQCKLIMNIEFFPKTWLFFNLQSVNIHSDLKLLVWKSQITQTHSPFYIYIGVIYKDKNLLKATSESCCVRLSTRGRSSEKITRAGEGGGGGGASRAPRDLFIRLLIQSAPLCPHVPSSGLLAPFFIHHVGYNKITTWDVFHCQLYFSMYDTRGFRRLSVIIPFLVLLLLVLRTTVTKHQCTFLSAIKIIHLQEDKH